MLLDRGSSVLFCGDVITGDSARASCNGIATQRPHPVTGRLVFSSTISLTLHLVVQESEGCTLCDPDSVLSAFR